MQVQRIENNERYSNFGSTYTKGSIKFLKKCLPDMLEGNSFNHSKKALENLLETKKRDDNLLIRIYDDYGSSLDPFLDGVTFSVRDARDKNGIFQHIETRSDFERAKQNTTPAEIFLSATEQVKSDNFVKHALNGIKNSNKFKNHTLWDRIKEKFKINEDFKENVGEVLSLAFSKVEIPNPQGQSKCESGLVYMAKELLKNKKEINNKNLAETNKQEQLLNLINKLAE